jgi:type I restriction-modification system DNA methylase subunit
MQKITLHYCGICDTQPDQLSHHKLHLATDKHKINHELFQYKCKELPKPQLLEKYDSTNIKQIADMMAHATVIVEKKMKLNMTDKDIKAMATVGEKYDVISNREDLKDKIHDIHNILRNHGAGYGMNALKVFNILYGLKRLEERSLYSDIGFTNEKHHFSNLLKLANEGKDEELTSLILGDDELLDSINDSKVKKLLMYEIPRNIKGNVFSTLVKEIEQITKIEKECNVQLSGKIYEYFIGRDESAISELGAYFTDRHIVNYIFGKLDIRLETDGNIGTMIDPFGGSGGFTTGFINYINERYPEIDWKTQLDKIYHFDMNEDVIKSAGLEFFLLSGVLPNMEKNLGYKNSFADEFLDERYKYVITNPPYGGDKNKKSGKVEKRDKVKKHLVKLLKNTELGIEMKERYEKQLLSIKAEERRESKEKEKDKVTLSSSSKRINRFAKQHKLKGGDKEAVSLIQIMDMVAEGGLGCGVLKEGVFFNKTYKQHRRVLVENYDVECVISVPSSEFENTSTKTSIVIFRNNGKPTGSVKFYNMEITRYEEDKFEERDGFIVLAENEGDIKSVGDVLVSEATREQFLANDIYSLNGKDYNKREIIPGEGYEVVRLGDVCELKNGKQLDKKNQIKGEYPVYGGGSDIVGYHNQYNRENTIIVAGTGNYSGFIQFNPNKFWASQCFTIKHINDKTNIKYLYFILKSQQSQFMNKQGGSAQKFIRANNFIDFQIPIPTDPQHLTQLVDKISAPFDESHTKSARIKELEEEVSAKIKEITETEDCEEKKLGDICEIKSGKFKSGNCNTKGKYPFYTGKANQPEGFSDNYCYDNNKKYLILIKDGGAGYGKYGKHIGLGNVFLEQGKCGFTSHQVALNIIDNSTDCGIYYLYHYLNYCNNQIMDLAEYSTGLGTINRTKLENFKLKIPKDKTLIANLDPIFTEIEQLQCEVKRAEALYRQYIDELAKEAIKGEAVNDVENAEAAPAKNDGKEEVDPPVIKPVVDKHPAHLPKDKKGADRPEPPAGGAGDVGITKADLDKKSKKELVEYIKSHNIPHGRGSGVSLSATCAVLINHILKHS